MWRAPVPFLAYGAVVAAISSGLTWALYQYDAAFWVLTLTCGFVFLAPLLAMGIYEGARRLDKGERPSLIQMALVHRALTQEVAYLGLFLLLIYLLWGRIAQLVYGLSTYRFAASAKQFVDFAINTSEGNMMLMTGSLIGGVIAFFVYAMIVVSAPMLLDRRANFFAASVTSFTAVARNPATMLLWGLILVAFILLSAATGFALLIIVFPWLGLASWSAYRELVGHSHHHHRHHGHAPDQSAP